MILLAFLFSYAVNGQVEKSTTNSDKISLIPEEYTVLETNTDVVLVDEYLYYKLYVFSNTKPSTISKVAYTELIDANNNVIMKHTLQIKNQSANSHIFIPSQIRTGNYKLISYTNWSKNNTKKASFVKDINIINPFSSSVQSFKSATDTIQITKAKTLSRNLSNNEQITIQTSKKDFTTRESVTVDVLVTDKIRNGNYSVSIKKLDSILVLNETTQNYVTAEKYNTLFLPEMRGKLLIGKLSNIKEVSDVDDKSVALSIVKKNYSFKMAKTNASGQFFFNIDNTLDNEEVILQVVEENNADFKIALIKDETTNYEDLEFKALDIDSELKYTLEQRNIKTQIENAYYENKSDSSLNKSQPELFYSNLGKKYVLDDYTRFKTVRETFIEVIPEAGLRKEGDNYRILVYEGDASRENNTITNLKPLIVVDGLVVQNNNDLVHFNPKKIESITIVKGNYIYGANLYQGVIAVSTFLQDFKTSAKGDFKMDMVLSISESPRIYYQPEYQNKEQYKNIPDYRQQLLWIPNVTFKNNREHFKTYTSDDKGTYEITLQGYTKTGEYISCNDYFEVN